MALAFWARHSFFHFCRVVLLMIVMIVMAMMMIIIRMVIVMMGFFVMSTWLIQCPIAEFKTIIFAVDTVGSIECWIQYSRYIWLLVMFASFTWQNGGKNKRTTTTSKTDYKLIVFGRFSSHIINLIAIEIIFGSKYRQRNIIYLHWQ